MAPISSALAARRPPGEVRAREKPSRGARPPCRSAKPSPYLHRGSVPADWGLSLLPLLSVTNCRSPRGSASASLNLIYNKRALLLCGADGLLSPAGPPHPPPPSVRLGSLVKRPSLGMSSRPHLTIGTSCSQGAPASQRRRGAHPARPPRSVAPPGPPGGQLQIQFQGRTCASGCGPMDLGQKSRRLRGRCLEWPAEHGSFVTSQWALEGI